jgi:hypothetical protein
MMGSHPITPRVGLVTIGQAFRKMKVRPSYHLEF